MPSASTATAGSPATTARDTTRQLLRHVMVVGGTLADWDQLGDQRWSDRVDRLGAVADQVGASFVTLRAFETGAEQVSLQPWQRQVGGCLVVVDPCGDGRQRFAEAMQRLAPDDTVNEATIAEALYAPADCEPDLIVVLGDGTRLPPALVWELAYGELVFIPLGWSELDADHLIAAVADFERRDRRFGGLDE